MIIGLSMGLVQPTNRADLLADPGRAAWTDASVADVLTDEARAAGVALWFDADAHRHAGSVHISLDGRGVRHVEVMRSAAEAAGVECLCLPDRVVVCLKENAPACWVLQDARRFPRAGVDRRASPAERVADVSLTDVTLTAFCRKVTELYGVPVEVGPSARQSQELISVEAGRYSLADLSRLVGRQLNVTAECRSGALLIGADAVAAAPTADESRSMARDRARRERQIEWRGESRTWADVAGAAQQAGAPLQVPASLAGARIDDSEVQGDASAVLAALLLSEGNGWELHMRGSAWEAVPHAQGKQ